MMSKKMILVLTAVIFFSGFSLASAGLTINEIMYDLPGSDSANNKSREWIEIYNSGSADVSIDASKWRFYDGGANRTINGEVDFSIPASSYVIFAGDKNTFLLDHPSFGGAVYDTGFTSLNNTATTLKILNQDANVVDEIAYTSSQGGVGDGNSLQKISGSWKGAAPTPGVANEVVTSSASASTSASNGDVGNNNSGNTASNSSGSSSSNSGFGSSGGISSSSSGSAKAAEIQKIKTKITAKTLGFANLPLSFLATTYGLGGEQMRYGKYFWNFGDGDSKEMNLADSQSFTHTYFYPGEYVVSLDYFSNPYVYKDIPDASDKISVKIISANISISRVGEEKDFFVELSNNTVYDADLSNWILASDTKSFTIPRNTILQSKKAMIISPKITNFSIVDKNFLKLMNSQQEIVFDYSLSLIPVVVKQKISSPIDKEGNKKRLLINSPHPSPLLIKERGQTEIPISTENLPALALGNGVAEQNKKNSYLLPIIPIVSFIFIGASASAVYFIRQKKVIPKAGDDFEILDE